jgi:hypothetical protein
MRPHEICYRGSYWGGFPSPAISYGSHLSFDEAVRLALDIELDAPMGPAEVAVGSYRPAVSKR